MPRLFQNCRVLERVTKETASGGGNRSNVLFEEDSGIAERFRNRLTDFQMSGYDRGHMVGHYFSNSLCMTRVIVIASKALKESIGQAQELRSLLAECATAASGAAAGQRYWKAEVLG